MGKVDRVKVVDKVASVFDGRKSTSEVVKYCRWR